MPRQQINLNVLPFLVCLSGGLLLIFIQQFVRFHLPPSGFLPLFFGFAPNLIVGVSFPFSILMKPRAFTRSQAKKLFLLWCAGTILLLIGFEILRPFRGAQTFDYLDLLASIIGVAIGFFIYHFWLERRLIFGQES